jgi:hypothetical protein
MQNFDQWGQTLHTTFRRGWWSGFREGVALMGALGLIGAFLYKLL